MQSLRLSENGKSKGKTDKTLQTGPKKLSFDHCDGHNNASRAKGTPATRKVLLGFSRRTQHDRTRTTAHAHAHT